MASYMIGKLKSADFNFKDEIAYLNAVPKKEEAYDEFGQGYWKNLSLYNGSGRHDDSQYRNTDLCLATGYLNQCPKIKRLIEHHFNFSNLRMVRARNLMDGMVIPHRDFLELNKEKSYFRVFLPIEKNTDAYHSDEKGVFQMQPGELWCLDASVEHAAINFSNKSRMFLCLDFIFPRGFKDHEIIKDKAAFTLGGQVDYVPRLPIRQEQKKAIIQSVSTLLNRNTFKDMIFAMAKFHFSYEIAVAECYEWLIQAAAYIKDKAIFEKAVALKHYMIDSRSMDGRFTVNSWAEGIG